MGDLNEPRPLRVGPSEDGVVFGSAERELLGVEARPFGALGVEARLCGVVGVGELLFVEGSRPQSEE